MFLFKVFLTLLFGCVIGGGSAYLLFHASHSMTLALSVGITLGILASTSYGWMVKDA